MEKTQRVLIIEDDAGTADLLVQIVLRAGYVPRLARRGAEGLRLLRSDGADLVLLDLMMRGMDGWAVLHEIKADSDLRDLPVIIISAKAPPRDDAHAGLYADYFIKPFEIEVLVARIAALLGDS